MARRSNETATFFAQKKLLGRAHTSNLFTDAGETIGTSIQAASKTIFAEAIPTNPNLTLNVGQGVGVGAKTVEYVEFDLEAITDSFYDANDTGGGSGTESGESSQTGGHHAYAFKFKSSYQTDTDDARSQAGNGNFNNSKVLHTTLGAVQLVPMNFSQEATNPYEIKLYKADGSQIPLLANIDWQVDTYSGILFVQDFDSSIVPAKARAFVYIGDMLDSVMGAASGDITAVTAGTGLSGGGLTGAVTLNIDRPFSRSKINQKVLVQEAAESTFTISGSNISVGNHDPNYVDLFLNGQLLLSGTSGEMTSGNADYTVVSNSSVKFSFDVEPDDVVTLVVFQG